MISRRTITTAVILTLWLRLVTAWTVAPPLLNSQAPTSRRATHLLSTLAPTSYRVHVEHNGRDEGDDNRSKEHDNTNNNDALRLLSRVQMEDMKITAPSSSSSSSSSAATTKMPPRLRLVTTNKSSHTATETPPSAAATAATSFSKGAISMSVVELADTALDGKLGRARLVWDCYRLGIDPALFYGPVIRLGQDDYETILDLLPTVRRNQRLGPAALAQLAATYSVNNNNKNSNTPITCIEGGVATLSHVSQSVDRTTKLLLRLADGLEVEAVIIPWKRQRSTLCISSQVGCKQGCTFCATGRMGKIRSLTSDEILAQMFFAKKYCRVFDLPDVTNVVFMGMGEPTDNADAVTTSARILTDRQLFQLSANKVTISTVAPTPQSFQALAAAPCLLAWSVHTVDDALRRKLVPTTKYSMVELRQGMIDALLSRPATGNGRTTMLEVTLIHGVNDGLDQADALAEFTRGLIEAVPGCKCMINLIPYNQHTTTPSAATSSSMSSSSSSVDGISWSASFRKPSPATIRQFQERLWSHGLYAHVRLTRGDDESAACGQLATQSRRYHLQNNNKNNNKDSIDIGTNDDASSDQPMP